MLTRTVSELTEYLRDVLESDSGLQGVWVTGEVSNMTRAASGHWYFTLKDRESQLRCVMWRSAVARQSTTPRDGDALEVYGRITVYVPRGEYQLQAERVRPVGMGDLYQRFEALKAQLHAEGLFDEANKRPLPLFPKRIGVVTSPDAAAFQDVQNVLRRRFPLGEIILSPTPVQGIDAPPQIIQALNHLVAHGNVDVILLCRGGGSIEDLWSFNEEAVARAVAACPIPIVTGVGHEVDFTMVDFVSDVRAPTPSAGAELITQYCAVDDLRLRLQDQTRNLSLTLQDQIAQRRDDLAMVERTLQYASPNHYIRQMRQQIDGLQSRMSRQQSARFRLLGERLAAREAALKNADPRALLSRGYAIVTQADGTRLRSIDDVNAGSRLKIQLADGEIAARVDTTTNTPQNPPKTTTQHPKETTLKDEKPHDDDPYQQPLF